MLSDLARVRAALDAAVVGHDAAKDALLLGWLGRVHVLLEGPPGCAKSALAAAFATAVGERGAPAEASSVLSLGAVLHRTRSAEVERIHLERPELDAGAVRVLDDVDRAAPEQLARLDRDEGAFVIATRASGAPAEPALEAVLERFALRVRMRGILAAGREAEIRALLAHTPKSASAPVLDAERARALRAQAARVSIPDAVLDAASRWLAGRPLADAGALTRLLRAAALLRGAERVEPCDLQALVERLWPARPGSAEEGGAEEGAARESVADGSGAAESAASAGRGADPGAAIARDASSTEAIARDRALAATSGPAAARDASAVERLVAALAGRWERGRSARHADPAGAPRRRRPLRDLAESVEADAAELCAYLDAESADRPSVLQRERRGATPALLILRDVSASMQGPGARWSLRLVQALVEAARAQRLRVGYLEFNHAAERFTLRGRFVHRGYAALLARAAQAHCSGRTSYQAALGAALAARQPRAECDVVLISDGVPVVGDPGVQDERRLARRRGWKLHTVFVGLPPVPKVLVELARETSGLAFCVAPGPSRAAADATWSLRQLAGHGR